jgi:hypothetical protein
MGIIGGKRKKIQPETVLNPFNHDSRIAKTHTSDGRPIELVQGSNTPRAALVDIPSKKRKGPRGIVQYNLPQGTGKRHLAKALKKPLKRRKL